MQPTLQELEVWYILPGIRKELAVAMKKKGLSQAKIAGVLGITEAAVSQYVKAKRAKEVRFGKNLKKEIEKSAEGIIGGKNQRKEIQRLIAVAEKDMIVCSMCTHKCQGGKECFG